MSRSLNGQVAVVTGAARGVGALLARRLAARGARLALVGLEPDELKRVAEEIGPDAGCWTADVTDREAMARVAAEVVERYGRVDVVVANAGVATGGPFLDVDPADFERVVQVNLLGSVVTARAFLPALVAWRGYLLQIASLAAITPAPLMTAYCASKAGVEAFAHCLRAEVGFKGVQVGVGYLSWTDTDMVRGADEDDVMREARSRLPWPASRTYPLEPAVERIADGIARRSPHVYAQWWLRGMQSVRGYLPGLIGGALGRREMRRLEPRITAAGGVRQGLVGRGGAADERARSERPV
ncbi:SDR family oxidoreductase [Actinacidiphila glaucinigra]|uniref:SDR family oxidoreductase n=1 Tax=Actinacidiphila glaucinigra TaxID=235986 RepID=UPI0033B5181B